MAKDPLIASDPKKFNLFYVYKKLSVSFKSMNYLILQKDFCTFSFVFREKMKAVFLNQGLE